MFLCDKSNSNTINEDDENHTSDKNNKAAFQSKADHPRMRPFSYPVTSGHVIKTADFGDHTFDPL